MAESLTSGTAEMRLITVDSSKRGITPTQRLKWSETPTQTWGKLTCAAGPWHRPGGFGLQLQRR